ncbi:MAG: response regulator [Clostridiales bacterium]|nr:response regulator [Clostridiales bacterium]
MKRLNLKNDEKDILIMTKNIDLQKEREEALKAKLKSLENDNQKKSGLISRVSHDIRTPMNIIIGMANIGRNSEGDPVKTKCCLDKILTASEYVMTLINIILDAAKLEHNADVRINDKFNLEQLIEDVTNIVLPQIEEKLIDFQVCVGELTSRKFIGDRILLNRVLINLISNSTKFVDVGGQIILSIEELSVEKEQIEICFTVKDNGVGITGEFLEKVFQPFEQEKYEFDTSYGGTGLGLSICKILVEKIGGKISVQSEEKKGSQFIVEVPLIIQSNDYYDENKMESLEIRDAQKQDYLGKRILVVEDNELNIEIILAILEEKNLKIEIATNGQEAIELFGKSSEEYYDLILMDIMMPIKNGIEATCEIRNLDRKDSKEIPIIAMTADGCTNGIFNILEDKLNDVVLKPIDTEKLFSTLHFWLKTL